jgi:long-subunit fatty acid transport protein
MSRSVATEALRNIVIRNIVTTEIALQNFRCSLAILGAAGLLTFVQRADAAGLEDSVSGTLALGRAAAALRVDDFMAIWTNPANLALLPGSDLGVELRLPLFGGCFDRAKDNSVAYRTNDPERGLMGSESFAKVCDHAAAFPSGNLGWARSLGDRFGIGIGFFTPAMVPAHAYGDDVIVTQLPREAEQFAITADGTESPNRFLLLDRTTIGGFLQAAAAFAPAEWVRLGVSLGVGFASIQNRNVASVLGGTFQDQEILTELHAADWFVPRMTASVVVTPLPALELMLGITTQADVIAEGDMELTANGLRDVPLINCRSTDAGEPHTHCTIDDVRLTVPFPSIEATLGIRYAQRRAPLQPGARRTLDPMKDEVWDVELNGYWSSTSDIDQYALRISEEQPGSPGAPSLAFSTAPGSATLALPQHPVVPRQFDDTFGVRLGGDYNWLPEKLAVRLGFSYETRAVPPEYMNIDIWPVAKLGIHAGATLALGERYRITAAYSHVFYQAVEVAVGEGRVPEIVSQAPDAALPVNEGAYNASLDVLSVQANARF